MSRFVLTAQLQLQAPANTRQVVAQIQRQLQGGVNLNVNVQNAGRSQRQLQQLNQQVNNLNTAGQRMGRTFGVALRRFTAFAIASRGVSLFTNSLGNAISEAIDFERELVKVSQVTGKTLKQLDGLTSTITNLSVSLGVSSRELLSTTRILAQAGIRAGDLDVALSALAKTSLAATFEDITKTAEGAVALVAQFGEGVGALEKQLGAINAVSAQFAVESGDLISAIRRTGGVFVSAGGDLNQFLGLFTSIRATTRESAESIATGLRTILTRIQRPKTIEFLQRFGVELVDLEGKFVGPYEAVRRLGEAFAGLDRGDITFVRVAEELGGFRQIGKVIPLLQQFETAERARQAAIEGGDSLNKDYITAQQALAVQFQKVREEFLALVRGISETGTFQILTKTALQLTSQLIKLADAFKPLLPLIGAFAAFKLARGAGSFLSGVGAGLRNISTRNMGGPIGFATGGVVPGTGNRDTVPAMLTPGEFVIRKSSVNKIGAGTLAAMNENRFRAGGGVVSDFSASKPYLKYERETFNKSAGSIFNKTQSGAIYANKFNPDDSFDFQIKEEGIDLADYALEGRKDTAGKLYEEYQLAARNLRDTERGNAFEAILAELGVFTPAKKAVGKKGNEKYSRIDGKIGNRLVEIKSNKEALNLRNINEKVIGGALKPNSEIDQILQKRLTDTKLDLEKNRINFGALTVLKDITETELNPNVRKDLLKKAKKSTGYNAETNTLRAGQGLTLAEQAERARRNQNFFGGAIQKFAKGGSPSDTVPALLTPGEFVINKEAASRIGKANLDTMNKKGVAGFAAGGSVGTIQRFFGGGGPDGNSADAHWDAVADSVEEAAKRAAESWDSKAMAIKTEISQTNAKKVQAEEAQQRDASNVKREAATQNELDLTVLQSLTDRIPELKDALSGNTDAITANDLSQASLREQLVAQKEALAATSDAYYKAAEAAEGPNSMRTQEKGEINKRRKEIEKIDNELNTPGVSDERRAELKTQKGIAEEGIAKRENKINASEEFLRELEKQIKLESDAIDKSKEALIAGEIAEQELTDQRKELSKALADSITTAKSLKDKTTAYAQSNAQTGTQGDFKSFSTMATGVETKAKAASDKKFKKEAAAADMRKTMMSGAKKTDEKTDCDLCKEVTTIGAMVKQGFETLIKELRTFGKNFNKVARKKIGAGAGAGSGAGAGAGSSTGKGSSGDSPVDASVQNLGLAGGIGAQLFGANAVLANFTTSGEEAAKQNFNLANAASAGVNNFLLFGAAIQQSQKFLEENVKTRKFVDKDGKERTAAKFKKGSKADNITKSIGKFGDKLSDIGGRRGGKTGKLIGGLGKKFKGLGSIIAKIGPKIATKLPVVGKVLQAITTVSSVLKAGFAYQDKYNKAIKEGNAAEAEKYAVLKDLTGIEQGLATLMPQLSGFFTSLRGGSEEAVKAMARSQALLAKANMDQAKNAKLAAEAFEDVASGSMTMFQALSQSGGTNFRNAGKALAESENAIKLNEENKSGEGLFTGRNILTLGGLLGETSGEKNKRIDKENEDLKKEAGGVFDKEFENLFPKLSDLQKSIITTGGSFGDFEGQLRELFPGINFTDEQLRRLGRSFENNQKAIEENRKVFQAMNLGTRPLAYALQGVNAEMQRLSKVASGSYNNLADASDILKAVASGAKVSDETFKTALGVVTSELETFGGAGFGKVSDTLTALQQGFQGAQGALNSLREELLVKGVNSASGEDFTDRFVESMISGASEDTKGILRDLLADLKLSDGDLRNIANGNFEPVLKQLEARGGDVFKELEPILNSLVSAQNNYLSIQNELYNATKNRVEAEKSAIEMQKEAAQIIAEFNGKTLSASEQVGFANQTLAASGVTGTSAASLSATLNANSQSAIASQEKLSRTGEKIDPLTGEVVKDKANPVLSSQEQQDEKQKLETANKQNQDIVAYARERVKIYQQEIAAAKQKLKLDQDAAKSLLSGDISKFSESINASIAADAFRSGDTSMLSGLSGEALSAGFDALTDEEKAASAGTLESLGISSGLADAAAGTSPEIQRLQEEGKQYAEIIAQAGDKQVDLANAAEKAAENLTKIAEVKFVEAQEKANEEVDKAAEASASLDSPEALQEKRAKAYEEDLRKRASETGIMLNFQEGTEDYEKNLKEQMEYQRKADMEQGINENNFAQSGGDPSLLYNNTNESAVAGVSTDIISEGERQRAAEEAARRQAAARGGYRSGYARGGIVYASRGMFIPRGTDTVPAMLTPGEFVVNRAAVQRGNNLQILRAMNGGDTGSNGAPAPSAGEGVAMARGGMVKYFNEGGEVGGGMSEFVAGFSQAIGQLGSAFGTFAQSVENLSNMKLSVSLAPTSVDVNVMGPLLSELSEQTKEIVLNAVVSEIKLNQLGNLERTV